jgi:uncharacterized protein with HEPN domain
VDDAHVVDDMIAILRRLRLHAPPSRDVLLSDDRAAVWVSFHMAALGWAASRLTPDFRTLHDEIPWSLLRRLPSLLLDHALDVDPVEVWNTLEVDLPELETRLRGLQPMRET